MMHQHWTESRDEHLTHLWRSGMKPGHIAVAMATTKGAIKGRARVLNLHATGNPEPRSHALRADHQALADARSIFPKSIQAPRDAPRILKSGKDTTKLGERVEKGAWRGMPIFSLTLEERATCPRTCENWSTCYGNAMPFAKRIAHGQHLETGLDRELRFLNQRYPTGFVVRLHMLGDFYSTNYVDRWRWWLSRYKALHVFGYTAWQPDTPIGKAVALLSRAHWDRFAIRLSSARIGRGRAVVVETAEQARIIGATVCPAQSGATRSCATCGLCWSAAFYDRTIAFVRHGMAPGRRRASHGAGS